MDLLHRLRYLFHRSERRADLQEEMRLHIELRTRQFRKPIFVMRNWIAIDSRRSTARHAEISRPSFVEVERPQGDTAF